MAHHYINGCNLIRTYRDTLGIDMPDERLAACLGIPIIHMKQNVASFVRLVAERQARSLGALLGVTMQDTRDNTGMRLAGD